MRFNITSFTLMVLMLAQAAMHAQDSYLDGSFGTGGIATAELFEPTSMTLQQDGKILMTTFLGDGMIYRFTANGAPDTGFGTGGKVIIENLLSLVDVVEMPDGKILAIGHDKIAVNHPMGNYYRFRIHFIRLNSDGSPDTLFSPTGRKFYTMNNNGTSKIPTQMKVLADGKVYVIGASGSSSFIAKFNPETGLDPTFLENGYTTWGDYTGKFKCMDLFDDESPAVLFEGGDIHALYVFNTDGYPMQGTNNVNLGSSADVAYDIKVVANDKMLITGSRTGNSREGVLLRLRNSGATDTSFGNSGRHEILNTSGQDEAAMESVILADGRIITGCQFWDDGFDFGLAFTTASGATDTSFEDNGKIIINRSGDQKLKFIAQQQDGKIIAAGFDENNMVMMRYDISEILKNEPFKKAQITVHPNPANDRITVTGVPEGTLIVIYNVSGQKIMDAIADDSSLDISSLAEGMYFLNTPNGYAKIIKK